MKAEEESTAVELSLEDLAQILCQGNVEGELQDRVASAIRTDPRFSEPLQVLESMAAKIGAADLWEGLERHQEFDRLLEVESGEDPAEVLNPDRSDLVEVSYRKLLAVAEARLAKVDDAGPTQKVKDRLIAAESQLARNAVFEIAEALGNLSIDTAERVLDEVRREFLSKEQADDR